MMDQKFNSGSESDTDRFLKLIQGYHAGQMCAGDIPQWQHCRSVAEHLKQALSLEKGIDAWKKEEMILSALGHNLYADTRIPTEEIITTYWEHVHDLIASVVDQK